MVGMTGISRTCHLMPRRHPEIELELGERWGLAPPPPPPPWINPGNKKPHQGSTIATHKESREINKVRIRSAYRVTFLRINLDAKKYCLYIMVCFYMYTNHFKSFLEFFLAPNGTRLSARCHFTGPKKLENSRAQPPPTSPRYGYSRIQNIMHGAV